MDKKILIEKICAQLEKDLQVLRLAALATYEAATNEESRPENEYDTRALEASYLAGAQAKRVMDIEAQLTMYKFLEVKAFDEDTPIGASAIIELESHGKVSTVFMVPKGGGVNIQMDRVSVQVITPASPLGEALVGLKAGDYAVVETGAKTKEYEVLSVS